MRNVEIELLLNIIDQGFDRKSWHGTNLRGSLRGLTVEEAAWRPAPDRRNIWELILHTAYWKSHLSKTGIENGANLLRDRMH